MNGQVIEKSPGTLPGFQTNRYLGKLIFMNGYQDNDRDGKRIKHSKVLEMHANPPRSLGFLLSQITLLNPST